MKFRHVLLSIIIAGVALYFTFRSVSFSEIYRSFTQLKYQYLPWLVALFAVTFSLRAYRWHFFCNSIKPIPTMRLYSPLMIGFMGNLLPLRAGEFIRAYLLGKREQISFSTSFATVVVERIFDTFSVLILFAGLLAVHPEVLVPKGGGEEQMRIAGYIRSFGTVSLVLSIGLVGFCYLLIHQQARVMGFVRVFTRFLPHRIQVKIEEILHSFIQGLGILRDPRGIVMTVILSGVLWAAIPLLNYPLYYCYNIQDTLPFSSLITVLVFTCVMITVLPTPGYLGPFQFAITFALTTFYGVDKTVAASLSMMSWFIQMVLVFLVGLFFMVKDNVSLLDLSRRAREEAQEVGAHSVQGGSDNGIRPGNPE